MSATRHPAVAGKFYPERGSDLSFAVNSFLVSLPRLRAIACIAPHAGYMYSGHVAGAVFSTIETPSQVIVLCPNHTGLGQPLSIMSTGEWMTPLGQVPVAAELALQMKQHFPPLTEDMEAHRAEHAIEVELPFLQVLRPNVSIVPIALGTRNYEVLHALGIAIAEVIVQQREPVLIIASSDMNHYESEEITRVKDPKAIDRILALDPEGLFRVVIKEDISMCGLGPAVSALSAALKLGASKAELIRYATSADVSRDRDFVVGYAGITIS
jgi:MEMO1 family protein